ncbi:glycosyltransferase family 2 protein [bacterium]|nr:MAG: glycosyltransferase family 2 protein [bacterium]
MITDTRVAVVIPNFNGEIYLSAAINSLLKQTHPMKIIVIENASSDNSKNILDSYGDKINIIHNTVNKGFAGGVNTGISYALEHNFEYIALFNNDAVANSDWLEKLVDTMTTHPEVGIVTSKLQLADGEKIDSTGEFYTTWGLPYPRGRGLPTALYNKSEYIFGASGGASLYRSTLFKDIGLFDEKFFAYYEDTDVSFRAQLADWKVMYEPAAIVNHRQGETSKKMVRGFTVTQTFKNLPMLYVKNTPRQLLFTVSIRFWFAYLLIFGNAAAHGNAYPAIKGVLKSFTLIPHSIRERRRVQRSARVTVEYIKSILVDDLPPDQTGIRKLRKIFLRK